MYGGKHVTAEEIREIAQERFFNFSLYCSSCRHFCKAECPFKKMPIKYDTEHHRIGCISYEGI